MKRFHYPERVRIGAAGSLMNTPSRNPTSPTARVQSQRSSGRGLSLIEVIVSIVILVVVLGLVTSAMTSMIRVSRIRQDVANVEQVILKTMHESMARGTSGLIQVQGNGIVGQVVDENGLLITIDQTQLVHAAFGRMETQPTPWLGLTATGPSSFPEDKIPLNSLGVVNPPGGCVFLNYGEHDAAIEILSSGLVVAFHKTQQEDSWTR